MKYYQFKLIGLYLSLMPILGLSQQIFKKEAETLKQLGIEVAPSLKLTHAQAPRIMSAWDSLYDIGKKQQVNNVLSDQVWEILILQEIDWAKAQKNPKLVTRLNYYLGHIYHSQKYFSKSIPIQLSILKSRQFLTKTQLQKTLSKLEKAYVQKNELEKALTIRKERLDAGFIENSFDLYQDFELYELALKELLLFENPNNIRVVAKYKYYKNIGILYLEMGKIDSARKYFTKGLRLSNQLIKNPDKKIPDNIHISANASFIGFLGWCLMAEGNYIKAIQYLQKDILESDDDQLNKIFKMMRLASCYIATNDLVNAKKYVQEVTNLTKNKEDKRMSIRLAELKSNYYRLTKQMDSAYFYANQYIGLKEQHTESIRKNQTILLLSNIEADARKKDLIITKANLDKVRSDKKAQSIFLWASIIVAITTSISLLVLFIYTIQRTKSRVIIEKKHEEIELLLKELHHRVKNNLQVIYSLINLQKRRLETPELNQSLSMVQNRIKTMSLVHQNLHENERIKDVNLAAYIKTIADYLKSLYLTDEKVINIQLDIDETILLTMDKSITIGLLVNEIMSNSLKYAFKGKSTGLISIAIQNFQEGYQMKISDNGNGFILNEAPTKSLGMYLIKNLVKQIQGKYEIESTDGTTYLIYFKA